MYYVILGLYRYSWFFCWYFLYTRLWRGRGAGGGEKISQRENTHATRDMLIFTTLTDSHLPLTVIRFFFVGTVSGRHSSHL